MDTVLQHLRYALRGLRRTPGFVTTAIVTLALGIGLATAVFTVAEALLLRPLPVQDQDRLLVLWGESRDRAFNYPRVLPNGVHATFTLRSATPYPTGVVGLHYVRQRG
jgi:hypothetical protein